MGSMHELALTESIVQTIRQRLGQRRVVRVKLAVGRLVGVVPEALQFCFELCAQGTSLEGARLEIEPIAARGECRVCGAVHQLMEPLPICPCGSVDLAVTGGDALTIQEVEVS
jgi:hydrogenase nickel incorporation protein HypA/HybF